MPKKKPSPQAQQRIIDHLQAGKGLTVCVSLCSHFSRLYGTNLKCSLLDITDLVERGVLRSRNYQFAGLEYKELLLAEVSDAH